MHAQPHPDDPALLMRLVAHPHSTDSTAS